jgi:hypothetical protein
MAVTLPELEARPWLEVARYGDWLMVRHLATGETGLRHLHADKACCRVDEASFACAACGKKVNRKALQLYRQDALLDTEEK